MENSQTDNNSGRVTLRSRQIFMIVFAIIALAMTAYATSGGVRMFLTEPYAWIGITALSVGFLALTSLVLGDGISSNKLTQIILITPFFLVAVAICWILSFASYHQQFLNVGKSDLANAETNLRQMGFYARDVTKAMNDQLDDRRNLLLESDAFENYKTSILGLADELNDREGKKEIESKLQTMIEDKRIELLDREAKLKSEEDALNNNLQRLTARISDLENATTARQNELDTAESLLAQVELAMTLEEGDVTLPVSERPVIERDSLARQVVDSPACNRRRAAGKGGGIQGTCYFALTEKLTETQVSIVDLKASLQTLQEELKIANQNKADEQNTLTELLAQHEIDKLQSSEEFASDFKQDTNSFLNSVNAFIDQPSADTFNKTANYCQSVTAVLSDINSTSTLPACSPQALTIIFKQFDTIDEDQNFVSAACDQTDEPELIINQMRTQMRDLNGADRLGPINTSYDKMRTEVLEACFVAAEQKNLDTSSFRAGLTNLYDRINPSQDPISKAMGKVRSLFDGTASARDYFPALLALLQELSLLLTKLFWDASSARKSTKREENEDYSNLNLEANPDDPVAILAAKNILLNTTFHQQKHLLPQMYDEEYSLDMRNHMRRITDNLFRKKLATKTSRGILLSEDGMSEIARQIKRHNNATQPAATEAVVVEQPVAPVSKEPVEPKPAPSVKKAEQAEAANTDEVETAPKIEPEIEVPATNESAIEEDTEPKPRKRRPIVVRPNFRREM